MLRTSKSEHDNLRKLGVSLTVLLLALFFMLQALHVHGELGGDSASHCTFCAAAHNVAEISASPVAVIQFGTAVLIAPCEPQWRSHLTQVAFFIRPPPVFL